MPEFTIIDASKRYDLHPVYLGLLLRLGKLEGRKDASGHWLIKRSSIEAHCKRTRRHRSSTRNKTEIAVCTRTNASV